MSTVREQLEQCRRVAQQVLDELDYAVRLADRMEEAEQQEFDHKAAYFRTVQNLRVERERL